MLWSSLCWFAFCKLYLVSPESSYTYDLARTACVKPIFFTNPITIRRSGERLDPWALSFKLWVQGGRVLPLADLLCNCRMLTRSRASYALNVETSKN